MADGGSCDCLCGVRGCQRPRPVSVMGPNGQVITLSVWDEEVKLMHEVQVLDMLIWYRESRQRVKVDSGSYRCTRCEYLFDGESEFVGHLQVERRSVECRKSELLRARMNC